MDGKKVRSSLLLSTEKGDSALLDAVQYAGEGSEDDAIVGDGYTLLAGAVDAA